MSTCLVTGAAGFIGSHLCDQLLESGYRVIGVDDLSNGNIENLSSALKSSNFTFYKEDIAKNGALSDILVKEDIIVHLASNKIPRFGGRMQTLCRNQMGAINVLERAKANKSRVVFTSTSDIYGKNIDTPFKERSNSVLGSSEVARWSYAVSKLYVEHLLYAYLEEYGLDFTIVRLFGSYGPRHARSWLGGPQSVFIDAALSDNQLLVHGDGSQIRSFCFIEDTINGLCKVIDSKGLGAKAINIGNDEQVTIQELANLTLRLVGNPKQDLITLVPYETFGRYEDVVKRVPDISLARERLGFKPSITLNNGMAITIEWHKCNPKI